MKKQSRIKNSTGGEARAWSVPELAQYLGCSRRHIWRLVREKTIGHTRIGSRVVILPSQLDDFFATYSINAS